MYYSLLPSTYSGDDKRCDIDCLLTYLILACGLLTKTMLADKVYLADILFFSCSFLILVRYSQQPFPLVLPTNVKYLWLLVFLGVSGCLYLNCFHFFAFQEFANSLMKLTFYICNYLVIAPYFRSLDYEHISSRTLTLLTVNALIAIYIYVAMVTSAGLPYQFFWIGQEGTDLAGYFGTDHVIRARGVFSEPAVFGLFQTLGLAFVLFKGRKVKIGWQHGIVILSIVLTISLSTYVVAATLVLCWLCSERYGKAYRLRNLGLFAAAVAMIAVACALTPLADSIYAGTIKRLESVSRGADSSANSRVGGSWELPLLALKESPVFGAGLGNLAVYHESVRTSLGNPLEKGIVHNIFAYVLGSFGPIGFAAMMAICLGIWKTNRSLGVIFFTAMFTSGNFLEATFWIYLCLFSLPEPPPHGGAVA